MNATVLLSIDLTERKEDVPQVVSPSVSMDLSGEAKQALEVLSEAMNSACYVYDAYFCDF